MVLLDTVVDSTYFNNICAHIRSRFDNSKRTPYLYEQKTYKLFSQKRFLSNIKEDAKKGNFLLWQTTLIVKKHMSVACRQRI